MTTNFYFLLFSFCFFFLGATLNNEIENTQKNMKSGMALIIEMAFAPETLEPASLKETK